MRPNAIKENCRSYQPHSRHPQAAKRTTTTRAATIHTIQNETTAADTANTQMHHAGMTHHMDTPSYNASYAESKCRQQSCHTSLSTWIIHGQTNLPTMNTKPHKPQAYEVNYSLSKSPPRMRRNSAAQVNSQL